VRVKCLAQEHDTMAPARARTRIPRSGDKRTNHEAPEAIGFKQILLKWLSLTWSSDANGT